MKMNSNFAILALLTKTVVISALLITVALTAGCNKREWLKMQGKLKKPVSVIMINQIVKYPMAKRIERKISTFSGQEIWINTNSLMHSDKIKKIELIARDPQGEFYDLKLFLNRKGRIRWLQLSNAFAHDKLGFIVDGVFYRSFTPTSMVGEFDDADKTFVIIKGPFDKGTAKSIQIHSEDNYLYFNDDDVDP